MLLFYRGNISIICKVGESNGLCSKSVTQSHNATYTQKNSTTHIVKCSTCGYSGTQNHFANSPGTKATCLGCGYVGNISEGRMSVDDEIASVDNDISS